MGIALERAADELPNYLVKIATITEAELEREVRQLRREIVLTEQSDGDTPRTGAGVCMSQRG